MILALFLAASIPAPDLSGVASLMGQRSMAQACPISATRALTNAHVIGDYERYVWEICGSQGCALGLLGAPSSTVKDLFRDLGYVTTWKGTFPRWYSISKTAPQPGDKVWFRGWDFRKRKDAFAVRDFEATVIRVRNGHVIYTPAGVPGTSGSCVLNAAGEVVAINAFGKETESDRQVVGGAVGVWEPLLNIGLSEGEEVD